MTHEELLIQKIKEYISLSPAEEQLIGELFTPLSLAKGDTLLREGAVCKHMYFIVSGLLRHYINYEGKELTVYFNAENSYFIGTVSHITSGLVDTPEQKYLRFLSIYKPLIQRLNLKDIASFVGVTPQSLSRIRNRMARS